MLVSLVSVCGRFVVMNYKGMIYKRSHLMPRDTTPFLIRYLQDFQQVHDDCGLDLRFVFRVPPLILSCWVLIQSYSTEPAVIDSEESLLLRVQ